MKNNPMLIEQNGLITENPPTHLALKTLGPDKSHKHVFDISGASKC
jgi:hypothetical protein